jgi:hypothetical protein
MDELEDKKWTKSYERSPKDGVGSHATSFRASEMNSALNFQLLNDRYAQGALPTTPRLRRLNRLRSALLKAKKLSQATYSEESTMRVKQS